MKDEPIYAVLWEEQYLGNYGKQMLYGFKDALNMYEDKCMRPETTFCALSIEGITCKLFEREEEEKQNTDKVTYTVSWPSRDGGGLNSVGYAADLAEARLLYEWLERVGVRGRQLMARDKNGNGTLLKSFSENPKKDESAAEEAEDEPSCKCRYVLTYCLDDNGNTYFSFPKNLDDALQEYGDKLCGEGVFSLSVISHDGERKMMELAYGEKSCMGRHLIRIINPEVLPESERETLP